MPICPIRSACLAHIGCPKYERWQEEQQNCVTTMAGASEGQAEGAIKEEEPEPSAETEDEERSDLIDANDGKHGRRDRSHHSTANQPLTRNGEVEVPVARSED